MVNSLTDQIKEARDSSDNTGCHFKGANVSPLLRIEQTRNLLAIVLVMAFIGICPVLLLIVIPEQNKEVVTYVLGQLSGMATMALGFYFVSKAGQDVVDAQRTENTGKALDAISAAAKSTPMEDPSAIHEGDAVTMEKKE